MLRRSLKIKITPFHGTFDVLHTSWTLVRLTDVRLVPSEKWHSGPENNARGIASHQKIYTRERMAAMSSLAAHKDFGTCISLQI